MSSLYSNKINLKWKALSRASYHMKMEDKFTSKKARRARYNLRNINLKMGVLSKAAYHWRKRMVASTELRQKKRIIYGDWLQEFYKLSAEVRLMIWKNIIPPGETNDPLQMPSLIIAFRAEKSRIMYQEVLEVYFKVTTLDPYLQLFPGGRGGDFLQWLKRGYSTQGFRSLKLRFS
jgi:hypothetical protein